MRGIVLWKCGHLGHLIESFQISQFKCTTCGKRDKQAGGPVRKREVALIRRWEKEQETCEG